MKTIEIISGNQKAQFTTKSVTFDGKEFFYSNMSDVTDHAEQCFYTFTYENESKTLPYEQKDAKILNAIFSQVQNLRTAKSSATADATDRATTKLGAVPGSADSTNKDEAAAPKQVAPQETTANTEPASSAGTSTGPATGPIADMTAEDPKAAKKAKKERRKAEKLEAKERKLSEKAENKEDASVDPERKQKLRKSLIIFGVIIAVIAVLSFVYFITFGTDKEPAPVAPSTDESQTYQDIDELTEQLTDK